MLNKHILHIKKGQVINKIGNQREEGLRKMSANDYCVVCGKYIPEGYGMVCPDCLKTYSLMLEHKKEIIETAQLLKELNKKETDKNIK